MSLLALLVGGFMLSNGLGPLSGLPNVENSKEAELKARADALAKVSSTLL